ncbi:hypothetical protein [Actinoallomurus spadix]|nr:hypothetical protein [Actinoallomurus spadix]
MEHGGGTAPEPKAELDALLDTAEPLIGTEEARRLRRLPGGR